MRLSEWFLNTVYKDSIKINNIKVRNFEMDFLCINFLNERHHSSRPRRPHKVLWGHGGQEQNQWQPIWPICPFLHLTRMIDQIKTKVDHNREYRLRNGRSKYSKQFDSKSNHQQGKICSKREEQKYSKDSFMSKEKEGHCHFQCHICFLCSNCPDCILH